MPHCATFIKFEVVKTEKNDYEQEFSPIFVFSFTLGACNKDSASTTINKESEPVTKQLSEDSGCIERIIIPVTSHGTLTNSDYNSNGINNPNFRYTRTYRDSSKTYNGTYDFRNVYIIQYANGLPIFLSH